MSGPPRGSAVAVVGYASLDAPTVTAAFQGLDATTLLERPVVGAAPVPGGVAHVTAAVTAAGAVAEAVSWTGGDALGELWRSAVARDGVGTGAVAVVGDRSPSALMLDVTGAGTLCLFDPGTCHPAELAEEQRRVLAACGTVLLTVAPRPLTEQLLDVIDDAARLVWAVKHDDDAYPPALMQRILQRADVVSYSRAERSFLCTGGDLERAVRPGALLVQTRGADGVAWCVAAPDGASREGSLVPEPVTGVDTTGAGDTFIGTLVAGLARTGPGLPDDAELARLVELAAGAASALLAARLPTPIAAPPTPPEQDPTMTAPAAHPPAAPAPPGAGPSSRGRLWDEAWYLRTAADQGGDAAVLVGDRGRVLLAAELLADAVIHNEDRGLTTATGRFRGVPVTVSAFGMGAPIAAVVLHELAGLGVRRFLRLGTVMALGSTQLGDLVVAHGAVRHESTSATYLPLAFPAVPDLPLTRVVEDAVHRAGASCRTGIYETTDGFYTEMFETGAGAVPVADRYRDLARAGVVAADMETSAIFVAARALGVAAASLCLASVEGTTNAKLPRPERLAAERQLLQVGLDALTAPA